MSLKNPSKIIISRAQNVHKKATAGLFAYTSKYNYEDTPKLHEENCLEELKKMKMTHSQNPMQDIAS